MVVISRESAVTVEGFGQDIPFNDEQAFSGSGTFAELVEGEEGSPPDGPYASASASQTTTVNFTPSGGPFTGSGSLSASAFAQIGDQPQAITQAEADSILEIVFEVLGNNEPFNINGTFDDLSLFPGAEVLLVNDDAGPAIQPIFQVLNDSDVLTEPTFDSGLHSLPPATYRLTITAGAGSSGTGPGGIEPFGQSHGLNFDLSVGQAVEPPPPPPPPVIPLPAGVWAGLVGLTAVAGAVRKSRRRG